MLSKTNYIAWAQKIKVFMQAHGVRKAIEPKDPKAVIEEKIDKRALTIIYQATTDDVLLALAEKKTSKEFGARLKSCPRDMIW